MFDNNTNNYQHSKRFIDVNYDGVRLTCAVANKKPTMQGRAYTVLSNISRAIKENVVLENKDNLKLKDVVKEVYQNYCIRYYAKSNFIQRIIDGIKRIFNYDPIHDKIQNLYRNMIFGGDYLKKYQLEQSYYNDCIIFLCPSDRSAFDQVKTIIKHIYDCKKILKKDYQPLLNQCKTPQERCSIAKKMIEIYHAISSRSGDLYHCYDSDYCPFSYPNRLTRSSYNTSVYQKPLMKVLSDIPHENQIKAFENFHKIILKIKIPIDILVDLTNKIPASERERYLSSFADELYYLFPHQDLSDKENKISIMVLALISEDSIDLNSLKNAITSLQTISTEKSLMRFEIHLRGLKYFKRSADFCGFQEKCLTPKQLESAHTQGIPYKRSYCDISLLIDAWNHIPEGKLDLVLEFSRKIELNGSVFEHYCRAITRIADPVVFECTQATLTRFITQLTKESPFAKERSVSLLSYLSQLLFSEVTEDGIPYDEMTDIWKLEKQLEQDLLSPKKLSILSAYPSGVCKNKTLSFTFSEIKSRLDILYAIREMDIEKSQQIFIHLITSIGIPGGVESKPLSGYSEAASLLYSIEYQVKHFVQCVQKIHTSLKDASLEEKTIIINEAQSLLSSEKGNFYHYHREKYAYSRLKFLECLAAVQDPIRRQAIISLFKPIFFNSNKLQIDEGTKNNLNLSKKIIRKYGDPDRFINYFIRMIPILSSLSDQEFNFCNESADLALKKIPSGSESFTIPCEKVDENVPLSFLVCSLAQIPQTRRMTVLKVFHRFLKENPSLKATMAKDSMPCGIESVFSSIQWIEKMLSLWSCDRENDIPDDITNIIFNLSSTIFSEDIRLLLK